MTIEMRRTREMQRRVDAMSERQVRIAIADRLASFRARQMGAEWISRDAMLAALYRRLETQQ